MESGDASEIVRLKVSVGGQFQQVEGGTCRYVGGETFLESVPPGWRYADLMFSLAEKVDGAVSAKYQLPGEDLDPDALISLTDDSDIQELVDEYFRALRLPGTPIKTFRLRLFLFPAAEEPYTPEDAAAAAVAHEALLAGAAAGSGDQTLREALRDGASLAARFARVSGASGKPGVTPGGGSAIAATPSSAFSSGCYSSSSVPVAMGTGASGPADFGDGASSLAGGDGGGGDGATTPSAADTELAWEAGFRAGQEAAARAAEEEWQAFLLRRMAELSRSKSQQMLGAAGADWHGGELSPGAGRWPISPALHPASLLGVPGEEGVEEEDYEAEEAAVAAELAAAAAAAASSASAGHMDKALVSRGLAAPLPNSMPPSLAPSTAPSAQTSPQRPVRPLQPGSARAGPPPPGAAGGVAPTMSVTMVNAEEEGDVVMGGVGEGDPDEEFEAMFETKYGERRTSAGTGSKASPGLWVAGGDGGGRDARARAAAAVPVAVPAPMLPPGGAATVKAALLAAGGGSLGGRPLSPDSLLPKHISIFGEAGLGAAPRLDLATAASDPVLPSHISAFGGEEESPDAPVERAMLSVLRAVLPEGDVGASSLPAPPRSLQLPTSFELLAGAVEGLSPRPSPRIMPPVGEEGMLGAPPGAGALPAPGADLHRSPSIEALLSKVQRIEASQVTVLAKIGEGAFGEVSLAECPTYGRVAVKWIKPTKVERHWASFWHEAELMSRLNHPNVLRFYGLVVDGPLVVGIMTEFAASGSLATYLRSGVGFIPLRRRACLALHAVNGMAYLHAQHVVHFDVKPDNLLVDGEWGLPGSSGPAVKVADFGLSKHKYNTFCSNVHDLRGTLPYMAPEMIMDHQRVTEKADVWSLGVVFWELLTLEVPFADMPPAQLIGALGLGRLRLPIPEWCEPEWRALMEACWVTDPLLRPTCRQLAAQLERIRDLAPA